MPEQIIDGYDELTIGSNPVSKNDVEEKDVEIDLIELSKVVRSNTKTLWIFSLVPAIVTGLVLLVTKPTYTAQATFLPPNSMSSSSTSALLGQLGAIGSAGTALGALKDPTLVYVGVLGSRTIAESLIKKFDLAKVYKTKKLSQTQAALKAHSRFVSGKDTIISIQVEDHDPKRAADLANAYLEELHNQNDRIALTEAGQKRLFFGQQLEKEKNSLADAEVDLARSQEKTGLIQPGNQARLQIETIAQVQADIASRQIQLSALNQGATEQNPDVVRIRSEILGLRAQLNRLENSSDSGQSGNIQVSTSKVPELTLIYVRKARDVKYHEALYELLLRQYESAKLDEARSAPLMQVVDYAVIPDTKSWPPRLMLIFAAAFLGALTGLVWILIQNALRNHSNPSII